MNASEDEEQRSKQSAKERKRERYIVGDREK